MPPQLLISFVDFVVRFRCFDDAIADYVSCSDCLTSADFDV